MAKYWVSLKEGKTPPAGEKERRIKRAKRLGFSEIEQNILATAPVKFFPIYWKTIGRRRKDLLAILKREKPGLSRESLVILADEESGFLSIWEFLKT